MFQVCQCNVVIIYCTFEYSINNQPNVILPYEKFRKIKGHLKNEVMMFLKEDLARLKNDLGGK